MKELTPLLRHRISLKFKRALGMNILLCDQCKWNWRSACRNPARPNATWCPEYTRKGR